MTALKFVSTRGAAPALDLAEVTLAGLARDGGLYVPAEWPVFSPEQIAGMAGLSYADLAVAVMTPFVAGTIAPKDFARLVAEAYGNFDHRAVTPLRQSGPDEWVLELFHGPTLAFKDCALQLLGPLFDHLLERDKSRVTIVGATSGDTGSAAIEACRDRDALDIFILYPHGRVSEIQRRQMTTVTSKNVNALAVEGTFDDCQDLVKAMFADEDFRARSRLSAVNSINWARVMAQIVYYVWAVRQLDRQEVRTTFSVPTGNFGNVFAGHVARRMGLPIERFFVASNTNDILTRLIETSEMVAEAVVPTLSPSMDIQISSNLERLLFELLDGNGPATAELIGGFREHGNVRLTPAQHERLVAEFGGDRLTDAETLEVMADVHASTGMVIDPHTAVGVGAARRLRRPDETVVTLATAHPAKFPAAVEQAIGIRPELPEHLADLFDRDEVVTPLPNDLGTVEDFVDSVRRA
mgnify:CR=1 FL=1